MRHRGVVMGAAATLLVGFGLIQLVPYGRQHTNPPVISEPAWTSPQVRTVAARACFDCHSNETTWPWYSSVAPASWLVQRDVDVGRAALNLSDWNRSRGSREAAEAVIGGEMPPPYYTLVRPGTGLTADERQQLVNALSASGGSGRTPAGLASGRD